jgi:hypothetical protein
VNTGAPARSPKAASERVLGIQRKLHKWASDDQERGFSDLHNLVCDPATLMVAWRVVPRRRNTASKPGDSLRIDRKPPWAVVYYKAPDGSVPASSLRCSTRSPRRRRLNSQGAGNGSDARHDDGVARDGGELLGDLGSGRFEERFRGTSWFCAPCICRP